MQYGLQLYSVRDLTKKSFDEALRQVAEMGYKQVETAGFFGHSAEEVRAMLDHYGLTLCSTHTGYREVFGSFEETLAYHKRLGCHDIVLPAAPFTIKEDIDYTVACINRFQPILQAEGMRLHYHNHSGELLPNKDGLIALEEFAKRTSIFFEIDTFWAFNAGYQPIELMEKYRNRMRFIHLKDGIPASHNNGLAIGRSLGEGCVPIAEVRRAAIEMGLTVVVESEDLDPTGPDEVMRCIEHLRILDAADHQ